jgi:hypothetical protein
MTEQPTNADLLEALEKHSRVLSAHTKEDHIYQTKNDERWDNLPNEIRKIFAEELGKFFKVSGLNTKTFLVTAAVIIGALTVIFGGLKAMLAWFGFSQIIK